MKDYDKKGSSETKPEHLSRNATLWNRSYVRATICCNTCNKPRLIFAYTNKGQDVGQAIPLLKEFLDEPSYDYICGDALFGLKDNPVPPHVSADFVPEPYAFLRVGYPRITATTLSKALS